MSIRKLSAELALTQRNVEQTNKPTRRNEKKKQYTKRPRVTKDQSSFISDMHETDHDEQGNITDDPYVNRMKVIHGDDQAILVS